MRDFFTVSWLFEVLFQKSGSCLNIVSVGLLWHQAFGNSGTLRLDWQVEVKAQVPHVTHFDKGNNWGGVRRDASLQSWGLRLPLGPCIYQPAWEGEGHSLEFPVSRPVVVKLDLTFILLKHRQGEGRVLRDHCVQMEVQLPFISSSDPL